MPLRTGSIRAQVSGDERGNEQVDLVGTFLATWCAGRTGPSALVIRKGHARRVAVVCGQDSALRVESVLLDRLPWSTSAQVNISAEVLDGNDEDRLELHHAAPPFSPAE